MQCVQCWNEISHLSCFKCSICNEIFCSQKCLDKHTIDVNNKNQEDYENAIKDNEMTDFQDEYPKMNEPFGRYEWER